MRRANRQLSFETSRTAYKTTHPTVGGGVFYAVLCEVITTTNPDSTLLLADINTGI
jgi:hypothetical protein